MLLDKNNLPLVSMEFMNEVHFEDIAIINELYELIIQYEENVNINNEEKVNTKYMQWYNHTVKHFEREEIQMIEKGFPPYHMHKAEHENALNLMNQIFKKWEETKDIKILKQYLTEDLPKWLINHIQTMDTVTAMFLKTGLSPCSAH
ncbi:hemerythrin family protein [Halarcobacter sp.]|uniref:bacteriohemerythrin n=1 Tax=Halarcobacter sp. TaxID=2321133 RepID=UPI002AA78277|nr:hemerythrin family protein [Halarcobacter sp.]